MKITAIRPLLLVPFLLFIAHCTTAPVLKQLPVAQPSHRPKRMMVLVFDQLRPDLIDRFDMKNFKRLRSEGISYPNAMVGHLSSVTVVSHPVITTGLFPKHLPWQDEFFLDTRGELGKPNQFYSSLDLEPVQYQKLLEPTKAVSLLSRFSSLEKNSSENHSYTLGQKQYAVMGLAAPLTGSVITLGGKLKNPLGWRPPFGIRVPSFFTEPFLGRFYLDCNPSYGSDTSLYPLDGNRFAPGQDPLHAGGDQWVSDGILHIFRNDPEWKSVFATFGSIDKILHILAEHQNETREGWAIENHLTLKETLKRADLALGDILNFLEEKKWLEETVILVTADHGGQANESFHGLTQPGLGTNYLFYANAKNRKNIELPKSLAPILKNNWVEAISHDSGLRIWTKNLTHIQLSKLATEVSALPGVAEVYTLHKTENRYHYVRTFRSPSLKGKELQWANENNADLVETMATQGAAQIVALLFDKHGYGFLGDHGGAQEWVQRIPLIVHSPNIAPQFHGTELPNKARLVDVNPILSKIMGLSSPTELDGNSQGIDVMLSE